MAPPQTEVAHISLQPTTHLSTPKGWKAESAWLADLQRTVYPHKWSPISCRSSSGQGKFAGQRPTFYQLCHATNLYRLVKLKMVIDIIISEIKVIILVFDVMSCALELTVTAIFAIDSRWIGNRDNNFNDSNSNSNNIRRNIHVLIIILVKEAFRSVTSSGGLRYYFQMWSVIVSARLAWSRLALYDKWTVDRAAIS